jgi:hypothetical protein
MGGRYFLLIPALAADGIQALLSLGLAGVFTTAGGLLNLVPVIGSVLSLGLVLPSGILIGFALNIVISATFGAFLVTTLAVSGVFYPRYLISGGGELIPGLNNLPFWTLFTLLCILRKNREEREGNRTAANIGFAVAPTRGVMAIQEKEMDLPGMKEAHARMGGVQYRAPQPQTGEGLVELARSRIPLQDIRPSAPHA